MPEAIARLLQQEQQMELICSCTGINNPLTVYKAAYPTPNTIES